MDRKFINSMKDDEDIEDHHDHDLGKDGAFRGFNVLMITLYLCRGKKDEKTGRIIDEEITESVLVDGKADDKGVNQSPIKKLEEKGFKVLVVYDYYTAIQEILTKQYRSVIITCSDGTGVFPSQAANKEFGYLYSFIDVLKEYNESGGGIFWMLENYPYTYEADIFFERVYGIKELCKDVNIEGGKTMSRDVSATAGHFLTVGEEDNMKLRIDTGLKYLYEGKNLACLNEREGEKGKMIIDCCARKLFDEFTSDGTSRWISNAVVWLLNIDRYFLTNRFSGNIPNTLPIEFDMTKVKIDNSFA